MAPPGSHLRLPATLLALLLVSCGDGESLLFPELVSIEPAAPVSQTSAVGEPVSDPPAVRALDRWGNPAPGVVIFFEVTAGAGEIDREAAVSDDRGIARLDRWTLGESPGGNTVQARAREVEGIQFRAQGRPGPPAALRTWLPNLLEAPAGSALPIPLVVFVRDRFGNPVPGTQVRFEVVEGAGSLASTQATTNQGGWGSAGEWRLGPGAGIQSAQALVEGVEPFLVHATALPGPPATLELLHLPGLTGEAGERIENAVRLEVEDELGNPAPGMAVETRVMSGGGTVSPASGTTDGAGRFTLERWELGPGTGMHAIEIAVQGLEPIRVELTAGPAAAHRLAFLQGHGHVAPPEGTVPAPPAVRVVDRFENPIPGREVVFRVLEGGGTVAGGARVSDADGRAQVESWRLGPEPGTQVLEARLEGGDGVAPFLFQAEAVVGEALRAEIVGGAGQSHAAGYLLPVAPAVRVTDVAGAPVAGVEVFFEVQEGGGTATPAERVTDGEGIAALDSWRLGPLPGTNRLLVRARGAEAAPVVAQGVPPFHLTVQGVHLNQANQSADGSIPTVAGRGGVLRVFPQATHENLLTPSARITLFHDGVPVLEEVVARTGTAGIPTGPVPEDIAGSYNLPVPAALVRTGLGVRVELDPEGIAEVPDRDLLVFPAPGQIHPLPVRSLPPLELTFFPVHSTEMGTTGRIDATNVDQYMDAARRMLPIGEADVEVRPAYFTSASPMTGAVSYHGFALLAMELQALKTAEGSDRYYHGIVQLPTLAGVVGIAYRPEEPTSPSRSAVSHDQLPQSAITIAHEIGHNLGRRHAPCGGASSPDPAFPYAGAATGPPGYDREGGAFRDGSEHFDLMAYCEPVWISDYKYERILSWREAVAAAGTPLLASAGGPGAELRAASDGVLVWGGWGPEGPELNPLFHLHARPSPVPASGEGRIRGLAQDGRILFDLPLKGEALGHEVDETVRHFSAFVPLAEADRAALRRVVLATPVGETERTVPAATAGGGVGAAVGGAAGGPAAPAEPSLSLVPTATDRLVLEWDAAAYPIVLVQDPDTGRILSFARNGRVELAAPASGALRLQLGEGVRVRREEMRFR